MEIQKRDKIALIFGGAAVAVFLLMQYAALPAWDSFQEGRDGIPIRERQLQKSRQFALQSASFTATATSAEALLREAEGGLLVSATPAVASAELQEIVNQISTAEGIEIRSNQFLPAKSLSADYTQVPLGIDFQCRMEQMIAFLARLAQAPRHIAVQKITITSDSNKNRVLGAYLQVAGVMRAEQKKDR